MKQTLLTCTLFTLSACAAPPAPPVVTAPLATASAVASSPAAPVDPEPFRAQRPAPGNPGNFDFPTAEQFELANGMKVYFVQRPSRVAAVSLWIRHGAASVPQGKSGLAGLTARMLTEGTRKKSEAALAEAVESLGTTLSEDASRDASNLSLTCLPPDLPKALALLAEVVREPAFAEKEFTRVRAEWLDGLRAERQEPQRLSTLIAVRTLFGAVHGAPIDGAISEVEKLGVRDLKEFHARAYTPDNAALVIVGPFEKGTLTHDVAAGFETWRGKNGVNPPPPLAIAALPKLRVLLVDRPGAVQSAISTIQPMPKRSEPGFEARQVMARALGGLFTSRLNLNLREEHAYTYGAFAQPVATRHWGALLVSTSVRTDVTADALDQIVLELRKVRDPKLGHPLSHDELARATSDLIFNLGAAIEHPSHIAEQTARIFVEQLPLDYNAHYPQTLRDLPESAVEQAGENVQADAQLVVIVGDRSKIEGPLQKHGFGVELAPATASD